MANSIQPILYVLSFLHSSSLTFIFPRDHVPNRDPLGLEWARLVVPGHGVHLPQHDDDGVLPGLCRKWGGPSAGRHGVSRGCSLPGGTYRTLQWWRASEGDSRSFHAGKTLKTDGCHDRDLVVTGGTVTWQHVEPPLMMKLALWACVICEQPTDVCIPIFVFCWIVINNRKDFKYALINFLDPGDIWRQESDTKPLLALVFNYQYQPWNWRCCSKSEQYEMFIFIASLTLWPTNWLRLTFNQCIRCQHSFSIVIQKALLKAIIPHLFYS